MSFTVTKGKRLKTRPAIDPLIFPISHFLFPEWRVGLARSPPHPRTQPLLSALLRSSASSSGGIQPIVFSYFPLLFFCASTRWASRCTHKGWLRACGCGSDVGAVEVESELQQKEVDGRDNSFSFDEFHHLHCYLRFVSLLACRWVQSKLCFWLPGSTVPLCLRRSGICLDFGSGTFRRLLWIATLCSDRIRVSYIARDEIERLM